MSFDTQARREAAGAYVSVRGVDPAARLAELEQQVRTRRQVGVLLTSMVVIVLVFVGGWLGRAQLGAADNSTPPTAPERVKPAEQVATQFLTALANFDADRATTYLADDADIARLTGGAGSPRDLRLFFYWLEAVGYRQELHPCEDAAGSGSEVRLRCPFDFHSLRSAELGLGAYPGSYFSLRVRDGEIVTAAVGFDTSMFSPEVWEPFATWVSTTYPKDAAVMYTGAPHSLERRTEKSIALWDQRTREYAADAGYAGSSAAYADRAEAICKAAHTQLNEELYAAGVGLTPNPGGGLDRTPTLVADTATYEAAALHILGETVVWLREESPPAGVRGQFNDAYAALERGAQGQEFQPTAEYWIHNVEQLGLGLQHCTFSLPR